MIQRKSAVAGLEMKANLSASRPMTTILSIARIVKVRISMKRRSKMNSEPAPRQMVEEEGWQPAVVLAQDRCSLNPRHDPNWPTGKLIRVKKAPVKFVRDDKHMFKYLVHPEDDWEPFGLGLCEELIS